MADTELAKASRPFDQLGGGPRGQPRGREIGAIGVRGPADLGFVPQHHLRRGVAFVTIKR